MYEWGGHIARLVQYDATRLTYRVFRHQSWAHIQKEAAQFGGRQHHGRQLKVWRWERNMYKYFGKKENWEVVAQSRREWNGMIADMVAWRLVNRY